MGATVRAPELFPNEQKIPTGEVGTRGMGAFKRTVSGINTLR